MSGYLVAVICGAGAFFMMCTIFLLISDYLKFQKSLNAIKRLAMSVKEAQDKRKQEIKDFLCKAIGYTAESPEVKEQAEAIYEKEIAFYKATMKILQDKSFSSIENYMMYVDSLTQAYHRLENQGQVVAATAAASAPAEADTASTSPVNLAETSDATGAADNTVAESKSESATDAATDTATNDEATNDEAAAPAATDGNTEQTDADNAVGDGGASQVKKLRDGMEEVFKAYMGLFGKDSFGPDDLKVDAMLNTVREMIASGAKPIDEDNLTPDGALMEQLKLEKVELMNRYDSAMKTLNGVYKEYAAAFGMDGGGGNELTLEQIRSLMGDEDEESEGDG